MSSEQVIACQHDWATDGGGDYCRRCGRREDTAQAAPSLIEQIMALVDDARLDQESESADKQAARREIRALLDRLSTPAAGGDDLAALLDARAGAHGGDKLLTEAAAMIRQLQARNAEQAAEIAELCRYARLQNLRASKLTALPELLAIAEAVERDAKDAARYRWLLDQLELKFEEETWWIAETDAGWNATTRPSSLDAAIDAALDTQEKANG